MFLNKVVQDLHINNPSWDKMTVILPSNRSIREFRSLLSHEIKTPIFSPKLSTIEEFIAEVSGLNLCDSFELQLRLFEQYQRLHSEANENFTDFTGWAKSVLSDFNEIDRYLIPPKKIFDYLSAISTIKNWTPNQSPTSLISEYTKFINKLNKLYAELNASLLQERLGYQGMLYRHAVTNIDAYLSNNATYNFQIIGLNALNKAEKTIIDKVLHVPKSKIYWDIDNVVLQDKQHSAGYFMRQNLSYLTKHNSKQKRFPDDEFLYFKSIQITGVPKNISQAKYVGQLLQGITLNAKPVALVLADETLLPAILNSIPEMDCNVNITMGYSIVNTHAYKFLRCILLLKQSKNHNGYYFKDVLQFLNNPVLSFFLDSKNISAFIKKIKEKNDVSIKKNNIQELLEPHHLLQLCVLEKQSITKELESLIDLFSFLIDEKKLKTNKIEAEGCSLLVTSLRELIKSISQATHKFNSKELEVLIESQLHKKTIPFKGDPSKGLQIMGLLETRALDFDTVIMTSVNEGIIPAGKSYNSFIPYDVKYEFGLPTIKEKDAVYTYHFYRLLQRAKNIYLIYNTEPDVLKGGEASRFIHQLTTDERFKDCIEHNFASAKVPSGKSILKKVEKTDLLIEHLKMIASKGFSPSSLSAYIRNPYGFYKQYVLGIDSPESVDEDVAYNVLGSIIHDSLEKLYQPLLGISLEPQLFEKIEEKVEPVVFSEFDKYYSNNALLEGKNYILLQVVQKYVRAVISNDKSVSEKQQLKIIALEQKLSTALTLENGTRVFLKGKLDRIDQLNDKLRIIDYKTGTVENSGLNITYFDDVFTNKKYDKAFQLLCYSLLYYNQENQLPWQASILLIKQMNKGLISLKVNKSTELSLEQIHKFKSGLTTLIEEIMNPKSPFVEKKD